jgi:hypothetical protein
MAANEQTFVAFVVHAIAGHKADFALTDAFIVDLDAAVAEFVRQLVSPPYLFMHSTGGPFLVGKNHHTLR